jgi:hypothetical protein
MSHFQFPIGNWQCWMAGRPRLLRFVKKEATSVKSGVESIIVDLSDASTGVAGHVFKFAVHLQGYFSSGPAVLTSTHLAPSLCEPGRVGHPLQNYLNLQRPFQLLP